LLWAALGVSAVCCGRIGYDPLGLPGDAGHGGSDGGTQLGDATLGGDAITQGGDAAGGEASAPSDALAPGETGGQDAAIRDASTDVDAGDAGVDADAGFYPACSSIAKSWVFAFASDPTVYDGNGDGIFDWTVRGGGAFPSSELDGGAWWSATGTPLDTRPLDDFSKRVIVDVRFLSTAVVAPNRGAVFWINVNENGPLFSALFASAVAQPDGGQALTLYGKPDAAAEALIATFPNLPSTFIDLHLDVDPTSLTVGLWIDRVFEGTYSFPATGAPNTDSFVTPLLDGSLRVCVRERRRVRELTRPEVDVSRGVEPLLGARSLSGHRRKRSASTGSTSARPQPDDGQLAVGLLLVLRKLGRGSGDLAPYLFALRTLKLFSDHGDFAAGRLDLHPIRVGGQVQIPVGILRRPGRGSHDQPAPVLARKPAEGCRALGAALAADRRQDESVETHEGRLSGETDPLHHPFVHPAQKASGGLPGTASSIRCSEAHWASIESPPPPDP
jgi:hypothetical protein